VDIFRVLVGTAIAFWLPRTFVHTRRNKAVAAAWAVVYGLYTLGPLLRSWPGWVLVAALLVTVAALFLLRSKAEDWREIVAWLRAHVRRKVALATVLVIAATAAVVVVGFGWSGLSLVLAPMFDDKTAIVLSGLLGSVFCGNDLVLLLVRTFSKIPEQKDEDSPDLALIGERIGWLERAVVFAFILGGQPSAAALAITAKSLARAPQISNDTTPGFVEYFLVGTLSSLLVALAFAVATRLALGLTAL
jgi:hypothetical protein